MAGYLDYWGKAQPASGCDPTWHPAAYHGLDVAAVGEALLDSRPQLLAALSRVSSLPESMARSWFLFALAIHDIGKFTCCFQAKVEERFRNRARWAEKPLSKDLGHGRTGLALWEGGCDIDGLARDIFTPLFGSDQEHAWDAHCSFNHWVAAVAGHHGRPVASNDAFDKLSLTNLVCQEALTDARDYIQACAALFGPRLPEHTPPPKADAMKRSSWPVAGLAMLCDWVGSNQDWFPYSPPAYSLPKYWERAQIMARDALDKAGLTAPPIAARFTVVHALGKADASATPLQGWAADAPISGQSLAIIEDLTGAGKTEAGLILAHRLMASGAAEGLYWALPTMATADALYRRLETSYRRMFADARQASLMLAHSASSFNEVFTKSLFTPKAEGAAGYSQLGESEVDDDDITASAACARWLADDRRKTFLADIGVGTIDQALLGVLPSKHQALRLAALSRRVLVIDEAHSYDPYMTKLLESLLEFQGALGGSAVVMSATLTIAARRKFTEAFARGAGWRPKPDIRETGFPLATFVTQGQPAAERVLPACRGTRRDLAIRRLDDEAAAIATLAEAASRGQGAVWIRNTVQDALDAQRALREALPGADIDLFHARFALGDRLAIERRVLASFGKASQGDQRQRIVIATQVVEQSLDCDWDVMISDLAPVDLLIQRAGRLHRHDHRPPRPAPVLHITGPEPTPNAGADWYKAAFPNGAYVYPHHGQLWLTMRALLDTGGLNLATQSPREIIERVFARESEDIPVKLANASAQAEAKAMSQRAAAGLNGLNLKLGYVPQAGAWDSDTRTPTRLGEPSRVLRLARWDGARLTPWWHDEGDIRRAWRLSEVSVRASRVASIDCGHDAALAKAVAREIAAWPETYDPPLLVPLVEGEDAWIARARDENDKSVKLLYYFRYGLHLVDP
jgi:CRISPR-associated endonuclease/helicase Cas3